MAYALDNALYQWEEGERRLRDSSGAESSELERAVRAVYEELRRRLGSSFVAADLVGVYGEDLGWAEDAARGASTVADLTTAVDCAFGRYARVAADWAGGRTHAREAE
ncbi:MAG: hypothetical protein M3350_04180 [Actinomycetota bacterium]|nr:hypothetical protein [Actinomycetota bacterium]